MGKFIAKVLTTKACKRLGKALLIALLEILVEDKDNRLSHKQVAIIKAALL